MARQVWIAACTAALALSAGTARGQHDVRQQPDIQVTATGSRIHVVSPCLEARCRRLTSLGTSGRVLLEGGVILTFHMADRPAKIVADRAVVGLTDGFYEIDTRPQLTPAAVYSEPYSRCLTGVQAVLPCALYGYPGQPQPASSAVGACKPCVTGAGRPKP